MTWRAPGPFSQMFASSITYASEKLPNLVFWTASIWCSSLPLWSKALQHSCKQGSQKIWFWFYLSIYSLCSQSHETNLDKRMIKKLAGRPPHLWVAFQAVAKEVLPFWAHFVRNRRFMTHPHFIHDLEVVLIFVPRPLQQVTTLQGE